VQVHTREALLVVGEAAYTPYRWSGEQKLNVTLGSFSSNTTTPISGLPKVNGFDAAVETLCAAFDALAQHQLFRDPSNDVDLPEERVFIASWVDYCNKYGMGYALTDGSVGVHFNDNTTLIIAANKQFVVSCVLFLLGVNCVMMV
jgi:hypothetical protein